MWRLGAPAQPDKMTEPMSKQSPIEPALVRELAELLAATDLSEIEVEKGDLRIRVARQTASAVVQYAPAPPAAVMAPPPVPAALAQGGASSQNRDRTTDRVLKPHAGRLPGGRIPPIQPKGVAIPVGNPRRTGPVPLALGGVAAWPGAAAPPVGPGSSAALWPGRLPQLWKR